MPRKPETRHIPKDFSRFIEYAANDHEFIPRAGMMIKTHERSHWRFYIDVISTEPKRQFDYLKEKEMWIFTLWGRWIPPQDIRHREEERPKAKLGMAIRIYRYHFKPTNKWKKPEMDGRRHENPQIWEKEE
jgi:hypothetical protein